MISKYILQNLGGLCEFSLVDSYENKIVAVIQVDPTNYGLLVYSIGVCRISFFKLRIRELISNDALETNFCDNDSEKEAFEICLLNVFCLPFPLVTVVYTGKNAWAIGQETLMDLKPYIKQALEKAKSDENDDNMDTDDIEEFHHDMYDIFIKMPSEKYDFHPGDIFVGCNFVSYGVIRCHKNSKLCAWDLGFLLSAESVTKSSDIIPLSFLDFPSSFNKSSRNITTVQDEKDAFKPHVVFIHHNDPKSHMFRHIFGINCSSPNVICLIGHPDGKLLWSLCDANNQFYSSTKLQPLYDIKQPVVGIFFVKDIEAFEDCDFMLVVGALGQLTLISSKKYPSFTLVPGTHPFWIVTAHVTSSITNCVVSGDCLLHFSTDGKLWISNLSALLNAGQKTEENSSSDSSEFCCIDQMIVLDANQGLIILKTNSGNIYLTQLKKELDSDVVTKSLPSLMNECLEQSNEMQEMLNKKVLQSRLFAAISVFASIKFCGSALKEPISFSISEVNLEPRKYMLILNLKCFEKLRLDSELCHVTATVFTYFKSNFSLVTKTAPYIADEPTLCLELTDTVLQPPFVSIFPLFVEVGLVLHLPDSWQVMDCFKSLSDWLPFHLRVRSFMVHELNLLQSDAICPPQSLKQKIPKTLKFIKDLAMKRPISNILQIEPKTDFHHLKKFNLCLSVSSVEELMRNTNDTDSCKYIEKLLSGNMQQDTPFKESYLMSKTSPLSVNVSKNNNHIVLTLIANSFDSLIGLRIAVMETLLANYNQSNHLTSSLAYVNIPASIFRKCEDISKSLRSLYGKDVELDEVTHAIAQLYQELRTEVSAKLPIL